VKPGCGVHKPYPQMRVPVRAMTRGWPKMTLRLLLLTVACALAFPAAKALADGDTWTGLAFNDEWSDGNNWSTMAPPQGGDDVTIPDSAVIADVPSIALTSLTIPRGAPDIASLSGLNSIVTVGTLDVTNLSTANVGFTVTGPATFEGSSVAIGSATLQLNGSSDLISGLINISSDNKLARLVNRGRLTLHPGTQIQRGFGPASFANDGTLSVSGSGTASVNMMDFTDTGPVSLPPQSALTVFGGANVVRGGASVSGGGTLAFGTDSTTGFTGDVTVSKDSTLALASPTALWTGSGAILGAGKFAWSGGTLAADMDVTKQISTAITGTDAKALTCQCPPPAKRRVLKLEGNTTLSGSQLSLNGIVTVDNVGKMMLGADGGFSPIDAGGLIANDGTLEGPTKGVARITGLSLTNAGTVKIPAGTLTIIGPVPVVGQGYLQTKGTTTLEGGTLASDSGVAITAGTLGGHGTIRGDVTSAGTTEPSADHGVLNVTGSFTQSDHGTLQEDLSNRAAGPGVGYGQLAVTGNTMLAGALALHPSGNFMAQARDTFTAITCGGLCNGSLPNGGRERRLAGGFQVWIRYQDHQVRLNVIAERLCDDNFDNGPQFIGIPQEIPLPGGQWVIVDPCANRPGHPIRQDVIDYLGEIGRAINRQLSVTFGTNHHQEGAHDVGTAVDIDARDAATGNAIMRAAAIAAGLTQAEADAVVRIGGLYDIVRGGNRYQVIWMFPNHRPGDGNHVHVGVRTAAPGDVNLCENPQQQHIRCPY
jgi:hypothetical protein